MKRMFIRGLFGTQCNDDDFESIQRGAVNRDIKHLDARETHKFDYITYVMGKDNCDLLTRRGIKCEKICDEPYMFEKKYLLRNKIEIIDYALRDFEEVVFLDWDCTCINKIPDNFWDVCEEKAEIQACLFAYKRPRCDWRDEHTRKVANTGYLYIRDKKIMPKVKEAWTLTGSSNNDEIAFSYVMDKMMPDGKFIDADSYCNRYEPVFCVLKSQGVISDKYYNAKIPIFKHYFRI